MSEIQRPALALAAVPRKRRAALELAREVEGARVALRLARGGEQLEVETVELGEAAEQVPLHLLALVGPLRHRGRAHLVEHQLLQHAVVLELRLRGLGARERHRERQARNY